jgi:4-hydroxy-tetrahydrodipicolinate synthase
MKTFNGIFPIVNTTFNEDGSLDLNSQLMLVRFLIDSGVHGLALFGTASEGYTLTTGERVLLMKVIIEEVNGRVPVIVSTGHTGTDAAVALSREAEGAGADGLMILPPYFLRPDARGVYEYYREISQAVTIPIMIQDVPHLTQVSMGAQLLAQMGREISRVRYVKVEAPPTAIKVSEVLEQNCGPLGVFGGLNGHFLIEELDRGARGTMPGSDMADMFVRVWNLYQAGDHNAARNEFNRYLPLIRYELQPGLGVSVMKHNLHAGGIIASPRVRHPTNSIDLRCQRELEKVREGLDLLALTWKDGARHPRALEAH